MGHSITNARMIVEKPVVGCLRLNPKPVEAAPRPVEIQGGIKWMSRVIAREARKGGEGRGKGCRAMTTHGTANHLSPHRGLFLPARNVEKLLRRWATVGRSPESEFLIAIIAQAIEDKATWDRSSGLPVTFAPSFMASAIPAYCACIGVDPQFCWSSATKRFATEAA